MKIQLLGIVLVLLVSSCYSYIPCCATQTWDSCPAECEVGSQDPNMERCCEIGQMCIGSECVNKDDGKTKIDELGALESAKDCAYYDKLDEDTQCGTWGYPLYIGKTKCNTYKAYEALYAHQEWLDAVRLCLQVSMTEFLRNNYNEKGTSTCEEIMDAGVEGHYGCFLKPDVNRPELSICNSMSDVAMLGLNGFTRIHKLYRVLLRVFKECAFSPTTEAIQL